MTSPIEDIAMPYGVTMRGKGDTVPEVVGSHPKKTRPVGLSLPAGPCRIAASWDGPQSVDIRTYGAGGYRATIAQIPSGGQARSVMVSYGAIEGEWVQMSTSAVATPDQRGTLEVYPMPA